MVRAGQRGITASTLLAMAFGFKPAFAVEGIIKDLECAIRTAKSLGVRFMLAPVAQQLYIEAAARGHMKDDVCSVILPMEEIAGVEVRDLKPAA